MVESNFRIEAEFLGHIASEMTTVLAKPLPFTRAMKNIHSPQEILSTNQEDREEKGEKLLTR